MEAKMTRINRWIVGYVFVLAGVLKWTVPAFADRFAHIGIPFPQFSVLIVGTMELVCGSLICFNLHIRKAVIPLAAIMVGAIVSVKIPLLYHSGAVHFLQESRIDLIMLALLSALWFEYKKWQSPL